MNVVGCWRRCGLQATALAVLAATGAGTARAQDGAPPRGAVLHTTTSRTDLGDLARAVDRVLRARLDALGTLDVSGTPALDLADLQLAVGCMGETVECLGTVAAQLEVPVLVLPSLDRAGDETVVSVALFDTRESSSRRVARRVSGRDTEQAVLGALDGLLRELFGLPELPPGAEVSLTTPPDTRDPDGGGGVSPVPIIAFGTAGALLVSGLVVSIRSRATNEDYDDAPTSTVDEVNRAVSLRSKARRQSRAGAALLIAGGAVAAGGVTLLFVLRPRDPDSPAVEVTGGPTDVAIGVRVPLGGAR